ncbi:MAG: recombination protein RecR [Candidatus Doudnabacteria bacterium]|nr:recombination protein RecR [Candidatus Doudnabacteria bacterium]
MLKLPPSLSRLINELSKLPGIGPKSAQRLAFYLLKKDNVEIMTLSESVKDIRKDINFCDECHNMAEQNPCSVCADSSRNHQLICVVEEPLDALALDRTGSFKGVFHVLGGVLSPIDGVGAEQLQIASLIDRVAKLNVQEIIVATNPTLEGETTAMHIAKLLKDSPVKITRIARGLPMGGDLEYADEVTLSRALEGRREF